MAVKQILIKFFGTDPVSNIISSLALRPDLLLPVVDDGRMVTDSMRRKMNYFFHRRNLDISVMEPLVLKPFLEPEAEAALRNAVRLHRNSRERIIFDLTDAEPLQAMAAGAVLSDPENADVPALIVRRRSGTIVPQRNSDELQGIFFPELTMPEFLFLNDKKPPDLTGRIVFRRRDLKRETIAAIELLMRMKMRNTRDWDACAAEIRKDFSEIDPSKRELIWDTESMATSLSALEDLYEAGLLEEFERKNHIVRILFKSTAVRRLVEYIDRLDGVRTFLIVAQLRNFRGTALCRDLAMVDFTTVSFIERAMPCLIRTVQESPDGEDLIRYRQFGRDCFGPAVRLVIVVPKKRGVPESVLREADELDIEITGAESLSSLLVKR